MAKKNFIQGLDSIFGEDQNSEELSIITKDKEQPNTKVATRKKKKSSKDFTADLDSLLQEALQESVEKHSAKKKKSLPVAKSKRKIQRGRIKRTLSGLDALIRQTVTSSEVEISEQSNDPSRPKKKRVTFSFDRDKVEKLKSIARMEKSYIKDIVNSIVTEYIEDYEKSKGEVD